MTQPSTAKLVSERETHFNCLLLYTPSMGYYDAISQFPTKIINFQT